ncbi:unnamed protein product [Dracunculus medinensis]|uniref:Uncharacterized protein n=1 Tax=Dracunculus medinensis TaxID=318479 RepID=A0A0N4UAQ9_DRAME|nr:unnamed protein product [Dracunculus medinensis]
MHLTRSVEILTKVNEELKNDINNLKVSSLGNFEHSKIETEQVLETIEEYFEKKEKEPCLVGINIPEKSKDDESATADRLLSENIVVAAGFKTEFIKEVCHHGRKGIGRPRVLKIRLEDKHMAMSVLRNKDVRSIVPPGSFLRKDLTKRELLLDKQLRKECYTRNQSLNLKKYVVRNLQIVELRQPRQWIAPTSNFLIPTYSHQSAAA